jgi:hypothetical protein
MLNLDHVKVPKLISNIKLRNREFPLFGTEFYECVTFLIIAGCFYQFDFVDVIF